MKRAPGIVLICYVCKEKFENKDLKEKKFRGHYYYTREYRGATQSICNLKYSVPKKVPICS